MCSFDQGFDTVIGKRQGENIDTFHIIVQLKDNEYVSIHLAHFSDHEDDGPEIF